MTTAMQTHRIHIKATPEEVWDALLNRGEEYGYHARAEYDLDTATFKGLANAQMREYGMPDVLIDGEILEADLPNRLVQTWNPLFDERITAEPPVRLTWYVEEWPNGVTRLTLSADCEDAPLTYGITSGDVLRQWAAGR